MIYEIEYGRIYKAIGTGTATWSPLASGMLTGKYNDGSHEPVFSNHRELKVRLTMLIGSELIKAGLLERGNDCKFARLPISPGKGEDYSTS